MPLSGGDQILDGGSPLSDFTSSTLGYQPSNHFAQQIMQQVRRTFGDDAGVQLVDLDIITWINNAQNTIINRNRPLKARAFTDSIKGRQSYKFLNDSILQIESMHYDGKLLPNIPYSQAEQDGYFGSTEAPGTPRVWWEWSGSFSLFPIPSESKKIQLIYTTLATSVTSPASPLGVPDKYYETVLAYVMQQAYELDENFQASQLKASQFEQQIASFGEEERTAQNMTYESITRVDEGW